jgi:hypothetical protein
MKSKNFQKSKQKKAKIGQKKPKLAKKAKIFKKCPQKDKFAKKKQN